MILPALTLCAALTGHWLVTAVLLAPTAARAGHRHAVRRNGRQMFRTGSRRAVTGRF